MHLGNDPANFLLAYGQQFDRAHRIYSDAAFTDERSFDAGEVNRCEALGVMANEAAGTRLAIQLRGISMVIGETVS